MNTDELGADFDRRFELERLKRWLTWYADHFTLLSAAFAIHDSISLSTVHDCVARKIAPFGLSVVQRIGRFLPSTPASC
jgi:hypothetical protein